MEITKREIIFGVVIISIMIGIGIPIGNSITRHACDKALQVTSAVKVSDSEKFGYIGRTNALDFLAEGEMMAIDSVHIADIPGYYTSIEKVKEVYTMHTQVHTVSNGKTTTTYTTVYWSWDVKGRQYFNCDSLRFLGQDFSAKEIKQHYDHSHLKTIQENSHLRYQYNIVPVRRNGVLHGVADNKTYNSLVFKEGQQIDKLVERAEKRINTAPTLFWILWLILTAGALFIFYYAENDWLED